MSTITVTNIQATGETASRAVSGVAAAWVNFNGTGTIAIRDSVNVASLTDTGTGNTTVTVSSAMSSAVNYSTVGNAGNGGTNPGDAATASNPITSTTSHHETSDNAGANADRGHNSLILHGDLA